MNRTDLQILAELRASEAKVLLDHGFYQGAYYLSGYAIECALKACIAKRTQQFDFPDKKLVSQVFTHNLSSLLRISGMDGELQKEMQSNPDLGDNWDVAKDWTEESRYIVSVTPKVAADLYNAIADSKSGVLNWLKKYW